MSAVKRANRKAEHTTKNKHKLHPKDFKSSNDHKYISILGATPKEITSLKESSSAPKIEPPFNFFANHPSKKSKIPANIINKIEIFHSFKIEKRIEDKPQHKDRIVMKLGINLER